MRPFSVEFAAIAIRDTKRLDPQVARRIIEGIGRFAATGEGDVKKLKGQNNLRLRVGDWRVIFTVDEDAETINVSRVLHRREAYRN
jgi:mRNA interferase RelE/StbE